MTLGQNVLRPMPVAILLRTLQIRTVVTIQVGEYSVLILQTSILSLGWCTLLHGSI